LFDIVQQFTESESTVGESSVALKEPGVSGLMFSAESVLENIELKGNITSRYNILS
jgi:hypothetical protein